MFLQILRNNVTRTIWHGTELPFHAQRSLSEPPLRFGRSCLYVQLPANLAVLLSLTHTIRVLTLQSFQATAQRLRPVIRGFSSLPRPKVGRLINGVQVPYAILQQNAGCRAWGSDMGTSNEVEQLRSRDIVSSVSKLALLQSLLSVDGFIKGELIVQALCTLG